MSGFYCPACGTVQSLGSGHIVCRRCGSPGLRGFSDRPHLIHCTEPACLWSGWDDGEVNDDLRHHLRVAHERLPEPQWRMASRARVAHLKFGTGTRSWSAVCGQYLRSQGRPASTDDRRCVRCEGKSPRAARSEAAS